MKLCNYSENIERRATFHKCADLIFQQVLEFRRFNISELDFLMENVQRSVIFFFFIFFWYLLVTHGELGSLFANSTAERCQPTTGLNWTTAYWITTAQSLKLLTLGHSEVLLFKVYGNLVTKNILKYIFLYTRVTGKNESGN